MRVFISLNLPLNSRKEISLIQQQLKAAGFQARWVKPETIHLTLAFLGSITPEKVKPIERILIQAANQIRPIRLFLNQIGCFPSPKKAKIIFLSLSGELDKLQALVLKIRQQLKKENIWFDKKPFMPHLTLGRTKKYQNLAKSIKKIKIPETEFLSHKITLIKSTTVSSGPIYEKISEKMLK